MKHMPKFRSGNGVQRFSEGGRLGYEEDPQPGVQSDKEDKPKKPAKKGRLGIVRSKPRGMSSKEFIEEYKSSPASDSIREEARKSIKKDNASRAESGTRVDFGGVSWGDPEMTRKEQERIAKNTLEGAAAIGLAGSAGPVARGLQTAKRRYDIGKRVDNMTEAQQKTAFLRAAREAREVDGMRSGGRVSASSTGASVRGSGCEIKGRTKGRMC
jgi:hypothetical protein